MERRSIPDPLEIGKALLARLEGPVMRVPGDPTGMPIQHKSGVSWHLL
jgi:hypothetical protein